MQLSAPRSSHEAILLSWVLYREGSEFVNDPDDRGGATRYGITATTLGQWLGYTHAALPSEIKDLTEDQAKAVYLDMYIRAAALRLDLVRPTSSAIVVFDTCVLFGSLTGAKLAQLSVSDNGAVYPSFVVMVSATGLYRLSGEHAASAPLALDGVLGDKSRAAIKGTPELTFVRNIMRKRAHAHCVDVAKHPEQIRFLAGWIDRTIKLTEALGLSDDPGPSA